MQISDLDYLEVSVSGMKGGYGFLGNRNHSLSRIYTPKKRYSRQTLPNYTGVNTINLVVAPVIVINYNLVNQYAVAIDSTIKQDALVGQDNDIDLKV